MAHSRTIIRRAFEVAVSGTTDPYALYSGSVHNSYTGPFTENPSANILTLDETIVDEMRSMGGITDQVRELRVLVEIRAFTNTDSLDMLDIYAYRVEQSIFESEQINGLAYDLTLESHDFEYSRDAGHQYGKCSLVWSMLYSCDGTNPSSIN